MKPDDLDYDGMGNWGRFPNIIAPEKKSFFRRLLSKLVGPLGFEPRTKGL